MKTKEPSLQAMRAQLNRRKASRVNNDTGINEAVRSGGRKFFSPNVGGVALSNGMPIGGVDMDRVQAGKQLMPQVQQQAKQVENVPQSQGQSQQPAMGNLLQMTPQGQKLESLKDGAPFDPLGMADGGVVDSSMSGLFAFPNGLTREEKRKVIQDHAESLKKSLEDDGFKVGLDHSGSAVGPSSYLRVSDPQSMRFFKRQVRLSDHSKGPKESAGVWNVTDAHFKHVIDEARKMRALGMPEEYRLFQEESEKIALLKRQKRLEKEARKAERRKGEDGLKAAKGGGVKMDTMRLSLIMKNKAK